MQLNLTTQSGAICKINALSKNNEGLKSINIIVLIFNYFNEKNINYITVYKLIALMRFISSRFNNSKGYSLDIRIEIEDIERNILYNNHLFRFEFETGIIYFRKPDLLTDFTKCINEEFEIGEEIIQMIKKFN